MEKESVNHPTHYGGKDNTYEAIKVIEAWDLDFCLGNVVKYLSRAGKKSDKKVEDLEKALWYLNREIENLKKKNKQEPQDVKYQITTL
jgi:iron-sulfur cluster repair protein YtfE (RIC family)